MTTFTKAQVTAIMQANKVEGAVEEYAAKMGFTVAAANVQAAQRTARPKGQTCVTIVYSAVEGLALVTTNTGFAGRTAAWVINDWKKTVAGSRKSDTRFATLVNAEDVAVQTSSLLDATTAADKAIVENASAQYIAHFINSGYEFISKIKRSTQELIEALVVTTEEEVVESVATHYNAVIGATGLLNTGYKYNAKTGKFTKVKAKKVNK